MSVKCILTEQGGKSGSGAGDIEIGSVELVTSPRTTYTVGQYFDPTGAKLKAYYLLDGQPFMSQDVDPTSWYPDENHPLGTSDTQATLYFHDKSVDITISVTELYIVRSNGGTLDFTYGDTLLKTDFEITMKDNEGITHTIPSENWEFEIRNGDGTYDLNANNTPETLPGTVQLEFTCQYNGATIVSGIGITVNRKATTVPSLKDTVHLEYNGTAQDITDASYWDNLEAGTAVFSGQTSQVNARNYTVTVAPSGRYYWNSQSEQTKDVAWQIYPKEVALIVSDTSIALNSSTTSGYVNVTREGNGVITYSPTSGYPTGLSSVSQSSIEGGIKITATSDGNAQHAFSTTITVSVGADANGNYTYNPSSVDITVSATYWEWGDEPTNSSGKTDGAGDEAWWDGLKAWAAAATAEERAACVGKTKRMALGGTYNGSTSLIMRCVGADQDGVGTLAFNPVAACASNDPFGKSAAWIGSTVRATCQQIAATCAAKNAIKTVKKGTCPSMDSSRKGTPTYNDETVFLLSEREYGLNSYAPLSTANSTTSKAECTEGYNAAYSYFTDNNKRVMKMGDVNGNTTTSNATLWERSHDYSSANYVCIVNTNGTANRDNYSNSRAVAPALVIG